MQGLSIMGGDATVDKDLGFQVSTSGRTRGVNYSVKGAWGLGAWIRVRSAGVCGESASEVSLAFSPAFPAFPFPAKDTCSCMPEHLITMRLILLGHEIRTQRIFLSNEDFNIVLKMFDMEKFYSIRVLLKSSQRIST